MSFSSYLILWPTGWCLDVNSDLEYLNTQEYLCYLRTEPVQERLHAGDRQYETQLNRPFLDSSIVFNSQESLQWLLNSDKIKLVYLCLEPGKGSIWKKLLKLIFSSI